MKTSKIQSLNQCCKSSSSFEGHEPSRVLYRQNLLHSRHQKIQSCKCPNWVKILYQPQLSSTHCSRANQPPWVLVLTGWFLCLAIVSVHVVYGIQNKAAGLTNTDQLVKGFAWISPLLGIHFGNYYALTITRIQKPRVLRCGMLSNPATCQ